MNPIETLYISYVNDFITLGGFAEHYGISEKLASSIIEEGRVMNHLKTT